MNRPAAASDIVAAVTGVPASAFDAVGVNAPSTQLTAPTVLTGQPRLLAHGKPEVLYVGAEFCPFCAAERWPLIVALSRFGHFGRLTSMQSAPSSVFPSVQSFSFVGTTYTSRYVSFAGVELYSAAVDSEGDVQPDRHPRPLPVLPRRPLRQSAGPARNGDSGAFPFSTSAT